MSLFNTNTYQYESRISTPFLWRDWEVQTNPRRDLMEAGWRISTPLPCSKQQGKIEELNNKKRGGVAVKYGRRKELVRKYLSWNDFDTIHNNLLCINFLKSFW